MNIFRSCPSFLMAGAVLMVGVAGAAGIATPAMSDEAGVVIRVANRCNMYGPGFVELGNGACGIISIGGRSVGGNRIESGTTAGADAWTVNGTSNAALRNDGAGMLPGISDARHLRIQSGAAPYSR